MGFYRTVCAHLSWKCFQYGEATIIFPLFTIRSNCCLSCSFLYHRHFDVVVCGLPCYTSQLIISLYDNFAHNWLPLGFNILLSIGLAIRVFYKNPVGLQQRTQRKKHRKMVFQLLLISGLHIACVLPYALVIFVQVVTNLPDFGAYEENVYFYYLFWLLMLLQPFVCIGCLPEVINKIKKWWKKRMTRNTTVVPAIANRS
jgi:hypothetical protein